MRWRRRAVRSPGKRGRVRVGALRLPTADSLCDLKVARASKISGRKFSAAARQNPARLNVCRNGALKCNAAARIGFFLAALHSVAKRVRRGPAYHPTRSVPVCPETVPHASAATIRSSVLRCRAIAVCPRGWKRSQDSVFWFLLRPGVVRSSPSSGKWGRPALASTRGPCGVGGRAFRGLTRSATEWSAARRKPLRAAALHLSAAISADVKARRLPTSDRRKFPSGNFRSARDLEGAERVNPRKARTSTPHSVPVCYNEIEECPHYERSAYRSLHVFRAIASS